MKISIITVSYNSAKTIEKTILSVINQTYENIEYIIIDGASTDGTVEIIEKYKSNISFYVSEKDSGLYDAMNKGINRATGQWIGIINSDDWYEHDAVKNIVDAIQKNESYGLVHGNLRFINNDVEVRVEKPISKNSIGQTMAIYHPTVFIKKDQINKFGLFNTAYQICADWELILRLYKNGIKFLYLDKVIANFRLGGKSQGFTLQHLIERKKVRHSYGSSIIYKGDIKDLLIYLINFFRKK